MDFNIKNGSDLLTLFALMIFVVIAFVLLVVIVRIFAFIRNIDDERRGIVREPFSLKKYVKKTTFSRPIEREEEIMLHHSYDGIKELDNHLPPWWLGLFYGGVVFAVVYLFVYHVWDWAPLQNEEYVAEMTQAKEEVEAYQATLALSIDEKSVIVLKDEKLIAQGGEIYAGKCIACHGAMGEGGVGPNLTDAYWLHGGGISDIFSSVKYGFPQKGMIAWQSQLKPDEMQNVANYVLSLQGTNPPNAKEPQGDLLEPEDVQPEIKEDIKEIIASLPKEK